ncbi:MAG: hypothetical protein JWR55_559 [Aeromicrobium sp.]|nr:hypothetical protein [Aeromicrobium sp.]
MPARSPIAAGTIESRSFTTIGSLRSSPSGCGAGKFRTSVLPSSKVDLDPDDDDSNRRVKAVIAYLQSS